NHTFLFRATQDVQIRDDAVSFRNRAAERIAALLVGRSPNFRHPDPVLAIDLGVQAAFALMNEHVLLEGTHAAGRTLGLDELQREVARMFIAYVGIPDGASARAARASQPRKPKTNTKQKRL